MENNKIKKAGKIAKEVKDYAKSFIKKDMSLLEIAEKIENKIIELGGKMAFPTNLSINEIAAHYTPAHNDETIESYGFSPIINLSGHEMKQYELHAGITIPNFDDNKNTIITKGLYAIEPFASTGNGKIHDGKLSEIYMVINSKNVRSPIAREMLDFILEEYQTLPFCSRWLVKKFGTKALIGLSQLTQNENLHRFSQLVESNDAKVSQAENTILIDEKEVIITTE